MCGPVCAVLAAVSDDVVRTVYGEVWLPAAAPLRWLAVAAALRILFELFYDFLVVTRNPRSVFIVNASLAAALFPLLWVGARTFGATGAAAAQVVAALLVALPLYLFFLARRGVRLRTLLRSLTAGSVLAAAVVATSLVISSMSWPSLVVVLAASAVGGTVIVAALWVRRAPLRELLHRLDAPLPQAVGEPSHA